MKYHVNREGNPGPCKARKACPFGDLNDEHFPTAAEATKYYEKIADPIHKASLSGTQLSAFRRNGDFHMRDGDDDLLVKMESEEDNREAGNRKYERFSGLEFERMAEIADAKIQEFDGESGAPLDRYTRGVVNRLISVRTTARFAAKAIKESPATDNPELGVIRKSPGGTTVVNVGGIDVGDYAQNGKVWEAAPYGDWEGVEDFNSEEEARRWLVEQK